MKDTAPSRDSGWTARGFTLIEALWVVAVVVILSVLVLGVSGIVQRKAGTEKARQQLRLLSSKLVSYAGEWGGVPAREDPEGLLVYTMLFGDGVGPDREAATLDDTELDCLPDRGAQIYLAELDPHANSLGLVAMRPGSNAPERLIDPFGNPWRFRGAGSPGAVNPDFDLWSAGPDGREGTDDDIRNW